MSNAEPGREFTLGFSVRSDGSCSHFYQTPQVTSTPSSSQQPNTRPLLPFPDEPTPCLLAAQSFLEKEKKQMTNEQIKLVTTLRWASGPCTRALSTASQTSKASGFPASHLWAAQGSWAWPLRLPFSAMGLDQGGMLPEEYRVPRLGLFVAR